MRDNIESLGERRAERGGDSRLWSVEEALEAALRDIRSGVIANPEMVYYVGLLAQHQHRLCMPSE